jgi:PGF-pre-PGF domain-containing protein
MSNHQIIIESYTPTSASGLSGSGASPSKSVLTSTQKTVSRRWSKITTGEIVSVDINEPDIKLTKIEFNVKSKIEDAELSIRALTKKPATPQTISSGKVYQYFEITGDKIKNSLNEMTISFKVEKEWIGNNNYDPQKISLNRFTDKWEKLDTKFKGETGLYYYYEAKTSGLSYFAISGELCSAGEKRCVGNNLEICEDGDMWKSQECNYGCNLQTFECNPPPSEPYSIQYPNNTRTSIFVIIFGTIFLIALIVIINKISTYFRK